MFTGGGKPGSCGCKANWSKMFPSVCKADRCAPGRVGFRWLPRLLSFGFGFVEVLVLRDVLRVLSAFHAWRSTDASNPLLGFFMHDVTQAIHFFCGCLQKRATTCSLEVGNLVLAAAKQIGPRCSQAFARLTDVRQAGLVSGGYPDSYLLDLGLLRCWSCEVGPKVLRKWKVLSAKRGERELI